MHRRALLGCCLALAGCGTRSSRDGSGAGTTDATETAETEPVDDTGSAPSLEPPPLDAALGYTYLRPDGNRLVDGHGRIPDVDPLDVSVPGTPRWLVGVPFEGATVWAVVLADGRVRGVRLSDGRAEVVALSPATHDGPPVLVADGNPRLLTADGGSSLTHPTPVPGGLAVVHDDGHVSPGGSARVDVDVLPDARPILADGRLFVLAGATDEYGHGVLGDAVEAADVAVLDPGSGAVVRRLTPPTGVIEGIAPIVADVDDDGTREVLVTASDSSRGARLVALRPDGSGVLSGPPIGTGFRWRHQLAVAPFGPDGELEIAAIRTPHIGGIAEFYHADGGDLSIVATRRGYSSHSIGSRNLDAAAAGDFDGDGHVELVVPDDPHRELAGLRRVDGGVDEAWRVPVGGRLSTNLAAVSLDGSLTVAAGSEGSIRFWVG